MSSEFVHLHFHTHYSLLDGAIKIKGLGKILSERGLKASAITDHGNMHGAIEFYQEMKKNGVKPIIGMESYVADVHRTHRKYAKPGPNASHSVLLCQDMEGYRNLCKLSSAGFVEGKFYGKPRIDHELLEKHNKGIIVLSACLQGELSRKLRIDEYEEAKKIAQWYAEVFPGRYYIELQANGLEIQDKVNVGLIQIAKELNLPLVGTNDCHYYNKDQAESHRILQLMGWQKKVTDPGVRGLDTQELYIKTPDEMATAFQDLPAECLSNTLKIADSCELDLENKKYFLPDYPVADGRSLDDELVCQSEEGLKLRLEHLAKLYEWDEVELARQTKIYDARLVFELNVINNMGFPGYFLIVADFINWSKDNEIPVGPGRGSGAGSLVAYSMRITDIDPIRYELLFERFLNPDRISMPDFDIDFEVEGRERVIEYVRKKYGEKNVCQISAIGSLQAKGALRGVARVLDIPYADADKIAKLIPDELGITLEKSMEKEPQLKEMAENGSAIEKNLIKTALSLEGLNNNLSTHAAGVIIMNSDITDVMPVCTPTKGDGIQSMYTMKYAEDQGAVKFDFLGLRNLTVIDKAVRLINAMEARKDDPLDISLIAMDDAPSYKLLCKGDTTGVFQLESEGMKKLIQKLKPDSFEDIIALVALYRPGPLGSGMVEDFVERKHGRQAISYIHDSMSGVLEETYGVMVYQEQVMKIVQVLAGFSLGQADLLRRAIGKKIPEVLAEQRNLFAEGCLKNDIPQVTADKIFDLIDFFAGYGFNKSHSAAYALVSYQTAWLKANYPVEFMAALLTADMNKPESVVKLIAECRDMKLSVLPPDINESNLEFTTAGKSIRFGLNAIKNVGTAALFSILEARKEHGRFKDIQDLFSKIDSSKVNSRVLEALIKAGAFDSLEPNRRSLFEGIEKLLIVAAAERSMQIENQFSFFDQLPEDEIEKSRGNMELPDVPDWKMKVKLRFEKESLGFYISGHPLDPFMDELKGFTKISQSIDIKNTEQQQYRRADQVRLAVTVVSRMVRMNKQNQRWAILNLEDQWGSIEAVCFANVFAKAETLLEGDEPLLVMCNVNYRDGSPSLVVQKVNSLSAMRAEYANKMVLKLPKNAKPEVLGELKNQIHQDPGECKVILQTESAAQNCDVTIMLQEKVRPTERLVQELEEILGIGAATFHLEYKAPPKVDEREAS